jgi:glycosyltransferase involved in cell wall biosynthesis
MKKVLIVGDFLSGSGVTNFIMNSFSKFDPSEYKIDVISYGGRDDLYEALDKVGWHVYPVCPANCDLKRHIRDFKLILQNHGSEYDIIHFNLSALWNFMPIIYAKRYGIKKIIIHSHNSYFGTNSSNKMLILCLKALHHIGQVIINKKRNTFLACSENAAKWFFINRKKVIIIKNGIDTERFRFNIDIRTTYRKELNIEDKFVIGHVGVFEKRKNHDFLLDIFKKISVLNNDVALLLIGDGIEKHNIECKAKLLGIEDKVTILSKRDDVPALLQAMDSFVFPSLYEGLPLTLVEAQTAGLNIFASDTISKEVQCTEHLHFISLDNNAEFWAKEIMNQAHYKRSNHDYIKVLESGFDKGMSRIALEQVYRKL